VAAPSSISVRGGNAIGVHGVSVYGAHKTALCGVAKLMAIEWASHRFRLNALCPGFVLTPLSKPLSDFRKKALALSIAAPCGGLAIPKG
jgi:NAD(P)-dependent dehydrogenase (short-subunit alcohol dehydrogenase family)